MRKYLWRKHFAIGAGNDIVKPASNLEKMLDKPADPATWQAIQAVAKANATAYAAAFKWVPQDSSSIWPVWDRARKYAKPKNRQEEQRLREAILTDVKAFESKMPFHADFWKASAPAAAAPQGIKGFICALPMGWTEGENNHPGMNMILLTQNLPGLGEAAVAAAAVQQDNSGGAA
jgi:phospholipase D1/2